MPKEKYELKENPIYETDIRSWKNQDPVNAEEIMNPVIETLLNNTHAIKLQADKHLSNSEMHITGSERVKLNAIEDNAQKNTITSVCGRTGAITLSKSDVGLSNVNNTADTDKPLSNAMKQHTDNSTIHHTHQNKSTIDKLTETHLTKLSNIEDGANKYSHPNSGVTAGTYRSVTVNGGGHVTAASNPTTISGYGVTDVYTKTEVDSKINTKANTSVLTEHTGNTTVHITSTERSNWNNYASQISSLNNSLSVSIVTAIMGTEYTLTNTNPHILPLMTGAVKGTKLSISSSHKGIVINNGVNAIFVTGQVYFYTGTFGTAIRKNIYIYKNDTVVARGLIHYPHNYLTANAAGVYVPVVQGDVIKLGVEGASGDIISSYSNTTYLTVMTL